MESELHLCGALSTSVSTSVWKHAGGITIGLCLEVSMSDIYCNAVVGKVRPAGQIWPASSVDPARGGPTVVTLWPECGVWSGPWPGISHTQSVTVSQWAIGAAVWYATLAMAISNLQTPHQQQRDSWDSTKWQVGHPTPSFTSSFWHRHPSPSSATTWANVTSLFLCATQRRLLPCLDRPMLYKQLFSKMKNH